MCQYAWCLVHGVGVEQEFEEACRWYDRAAAAGSAMARAVYPAIYDK